MEDIFVYHLEWSDLSNLSAHEKAALSILSYVVSEVNALKRLSLFAMYEYDEKSTLAPAISIQRNLILRTTTAKLFEFLRFVEKQLINQNTSEKLHRVFRTFEEELSNMRLGQGFKIAKQIRHKMANHLDFDEAVLSVESIDHKVDCNFYLTQTNGNSYYPIGDEIIFSSSIMRALRIEGEDISLQDALDAWFDWILSLSDLADRMHIEFFKEFVEPLNPSRMATQQSQLQTNDLVGIVPHFKLPVFLKVE